MYSGIWILNAYYYSRTNTSRSFVAQQSTTTFKLYTTKQVMSLCGKTQKLLTECHDFPNTRKNFGFPLGLFYFHNINMLKRRICLTRQFGLIWPINIKYRSKNIISDYILGILFSVTNGNPMHWQKNIRFQRVNGELLFKIFEVHISASI